MAGLSDRTLLAALAGFVATLPMTSAMSRMHARLPRGERYPLPPRELSENLPHAGVRPSSATLFYHFLYGAASGALFAAMPKRSAAHGAAFGVAVWSASYLGWIPLAGILKPGTEHPVRRNGLMLAAHLVWGAALALSLKELEAARPQSMSRANAANPRLEDRRS
jgi:hypothetical protein